MVRPLYGLFPHFQALAAANFVDITGKNWRRRTANVFAGALEAVGDMDRSQGAKDRVNVPIRRVMPGDGFH